MAKKQYSKINMNGNAITGLPTPSANSDAATKQYVDENAGGAPLASNVSFTAPTGFPTTPNNPADNVQEAIDNLFTYANDGKSTIAGVIGSPAASSDTFATLAGYVTTAKGALDTFIDSAEGTTNGNETLAQLTAKLNDVRVFKQRVNLKKAAGSTTTIPLASPYPTLDKLVVTPFVRINDTATTDIVASFSNGDETDFLPNDYVLFSGGVAQLKNNYTYTANSIGNGISEWTIDASQFLEFKDLSISGTTLSLVALPFPQVLEANDDIPLTNVLDITRIQSYISGIIPVYFAVSLDGGTRWYSNSTNTVGGWVEIDIYDLSAFSQEAMVGPLYIDVIDDLRSIPGNNNNTIRFAYLLGDVNYTQKVYLDKVEMDIVMSGSFVPYSYTGAPSNTYTYDSNTGVVTVNHSQTDAYIINYIDKL